MSLWPSNIWRFFRTLAIADRIVDEDGQCAFQGVRDEENNDRSRTALMLECRAGHIEQVTALITGGASVNSQDECGHVPLTYALQSNAFELNKRLFKHGGDAKTCLRTNSLSVDTSSYAIIEALIEAGAKLNVPDKFGFTPAQHSVFQGREKLVFTFFKHGAKHITNSQNANIMEFCKRPDVITLLVQLSPEFRSFASKVLRQCSEKLSAHSKSWLKSELQMPPRLMEACRFCLRHALQGHTECSICPLIDQLPIPHRLKDYLSYANELDEQYWTTCARE